jgi:ribonucleotide monophosphatase NagD (HAD superfamily)
MILMFSPEEIRDQIAHARGAAAHHPVTTSATATAPSLLLTRQEGSVYLVSSGVPESRKRAYAAGFEPGEHDRRAGAHEELATSGDADFVQAMPLDAFNKALSKPEVKIVVTRSYINVLGGQPKRPETPMLSHSLRPTKKAK